MIDLKSIYKTYKPGLFKKKVQAVSDLTLTIKEGEVFGLIGPNGAGKSTTIRMMLGLIRPDSGMIHFNGERLNLSSIQHEIGYLPENPYLYDHLTLLELLQFCGKTSGLNKGQIRDSGQELMTKLNLLDAQNRPLKAFSKGMLQRAGICFALLHDPSVVILDEPMSGLDPIGRKMVFDLVVDLRQQNKTVFFCSHILNDVERLCDRIGLIHRGCLIDEFDRRDFMPNADKAVFLQTDKLSQAHQLHLTSLGVTIREEESGELLAIPSDRYFEINRYLELSNVVITGCQSEWTTLEDKFIAAVEGQL
jgi:ABC-2 type transport system ATP-binding protein